MKNNFPEANSFNNYLYISFIKNKINDETFLTRKGSNSDTLYIEHDTFNKEILI